MRVITVALVILALPACAAVALGDIIYDPSQGTLPQNQGFTFTEVAPASPVPTVTGGVLNQGPTSQTGQQYWERSNVPLDFTGGVFTMQANLDVISSSYGQGGFGPGSQRAGYYLEAVDATGHIFSLGISSNGVFVNTDLNGITTNGIPFTSFNATTGFHNYRLTVQGGTGNLFVDGTPFGTTPVGAALDPGDANGVFFGDISGAGNSQTQLALFQYTNTNAVPEPSSLLLCGAAAASAGFAGWARRRSLAMVR